MARRTNYMMVDNRCAGEGYNEQDFVSCKHCQRQLEIRGGHWTGDYWCHRCFGAVCPTCAATGKCTPFFAQIEQAMRRQAFAHTLGLEE